MMQVTLLSQRHSKLTMNIAMCKLYMRQGKSVMFATLDQQRTIDMLRPHFDKGTLFELIDDCGVRIHERRTIK